ncbi:Transposon Ty3-G Gag-Pol polyprotein [Dictyocoela muelleri]|nr:Transposon Ty3-G Gag-Pol polyprotein [Dictyocoela muelleri]
MSIILEDLIGVNCLIYIDYILVFGETKENHSLNLKIVKDRLSSFNLKINLSKSVFEKECVEFLGYKISENKIEPLNKRSESIINYVKPKTKKQLMRFFGVLNYDRSFITNLSTKLKPLYDLLKQKIQN